jgi:hypothetical protein
MKMSQILLKLALIELWNHRKELFSEVNDDEIKVPIKRNNSVYIKSNNNKPNYILNNTHRRYTLSSESNNKKTTFKLKGKKHDKSKRKKCC